MPARIRLDLISASDADGNTRSWRLRVDGTDAGILAAVRDGGLVFLTLDVSPEFADRGVARGAIGRLLGLAPWGPEVSYAWHTDDADTARALGFSPDETDPRRWTRAAPPPHPRADDITRFLTPAGRIDRYPQRDTQRRELLAWVAERAIPTGVAFTESELGQRLEPFAPGGDVAVLRRYLVDAGLLERTRSGSQYSRT